MVKIPEKEKAVDHAEEKILKECSNCYEEFKVEDWRKKCPICNEWSLKEI